MANRVSAEPATSAEPAAAAVMRLRRPATAAVSTPATVSARAKSPAVLARPSS
jgi:hypothetical protein